MLQITHQSRSDVDYYAFLGVERTATEKELKRAINSMLMLTHPDTGSGVTRAFEMARDAQEVLLNKTNRKIYDQTGLLKPDIDEVAAELAEQILELYLRGTKNNKMIKKLLVKNYNDLFDSQEAQIKSTKKVISTINDILEEIEPDNMLDKFVFGHFEAKRREQQQMLIAMEEVCKKLNARRILARTLNMKEQVETAEDALSAFFNSAGGPKTFTFTSNFK